jgi:hypothetical protein
MALQVRPESTQPASNPRISSNPSVRWGVDSADSIRARGFNTALPGRIYGCNLSCNRLIATKGLVQGGASIYGFFGTPCGLGLATATTSAALFPHFEHRIRCASSLSVTGPTNQARQRVRVDLATRAAVPPWAWTHWAWDHASQTQEPSLSDLKNRGLGHTACRHPEAARRGNWSTCCRRLGRSSASSPRHCRSLNQARSRYFKSSRICLG